MPSLHRDSLPFVPNWQKGYAVLVITCITHDIVFMYNVRTYMHMVWPLHVHVCMPLTIQLCINMHIHITCILNILSFTCSSRVHFARQPVSVDGGNRSREHSMDTSSSEYETPSVESGAMSTIGEEEFSRVRMHSQNQDLLAEVLVKDKEKVRSREE